MNSNSRNISPIKTETISDDDRGSVSTNGSRKSRSPSRNSGRRSRGRPRLGRPPKSSKPTFSYDCHAKENHGQSIFCVTFNNFLGKGEPMIFATAGSNRCTIYECPTEGGFKIVMVYSDPDPEENFYTCAWSYDVRNDNPLIAVAGYRGVIRVIDVQKNSAVGNYVGHGQSINQIKFHPQRPELLLSASKDHAMRLWNVKTHALIAIFGGVEGHRSEVLSIDFDMKGSRIISSGMDHSLKLWLIDTPEFQEKIALSQAYNANRCTKPFPTILQHFPHFSTRDIHGNYVDCVQWFGEFILSKSCENSIVFWKPGPIEQNLSDLKQNESRSTVITEINFNECDMWFVRFAFHPWEYIVALGTQNGKIYVWQLNPKEPKVAAPAILTNPKCNSIVRQVAISKDGKVLIAVCDDATVWRWDRIKMETKHEQAA